MAAINKTQKYNIEKICRACLQIKKDMRPLFEQLTATMLMGISKVQVAVGDGLPSQLCLQCVHQISRCHAFKDLVERNDAILREQAKIVVAQTLKKDEELADPNQYIEFIEVPNLNNTASQLLDSFFPETSSDTNVTQEILNKDDFDVDKLEPTNAEAKADDGLNSDEENYLQMVVFQATSSVAPGRHVCNLCQKEFKYSKWLKMHMLSHSNWIKANCKKPPMCPICERTFKGPGMLKMHMRTHEQRPPKQPTCSVCQRTFPTKTLLYRHRQTHFEQKTHHCTVCEKRFFSGYALRSHMARHRGERPYICSICLKSFYNPTDLKVHFRLHTGEKPLKCSECNKTFRRHSTLCQHMKKHKGIRNHVCNICNKAFYEVSKLNAHMRVHTGERPFECQYCSRKFAQQSALIYHKRTHTGEKPYACRTCPARFTTSSSRNNHMLTHQGNKKFVCPVCFKGCSSRSELRVHSAKHTGEKLFACEVCSHRFGSHAHLATHRRTHAHTCATHGGRGSVENNVVYKKHVKSQIKEKSPADEVKSQNIEEEDQKLDAQLEINEEEKTEEKPEITTESEIIQDGQIVIQENGSQKRFKCGLCVKSYTYLHSLKKHMLSHVQMCVYSPDGSERMYAFKQQQQEQQQQLQQLQQVVQVGGVQQLAVPVHPHVQPLVSQVQSGQQYPVISSVQLQQTHQQINTQPQLQVQTIQIHPQHQPIQIHAVGVQQVQQVQQEQLHVATSSCQTMVPNILQLQPGAVVSGLGQELGGVHRIILQPPHAHPHTLYTLHH